jgi:fructan beta-fructosidase
MKKNKIAFPGILISFFLSNILLAQQPDWFSTYWPHEEGIKYDEPYRGQFHFSPMSGWMNDINMLVYYNGLYYMTYQADHPGFSGEYYGHEHMSQGLATSPDLLHWTERGLALTPTFPDFGLYGNINAPRIFSGSGVVVSGTVAHGITGSTDSAMIALFTGTEVGTCLAWSNDGGRTWNEYTGNPVANLTDSEDPRDPCVIWYEPEQKWVMAIYENGTTFYGSTDLINWNYLSNLDFGYECPDFFELPLDGDPTNKKWVLQDAMGAYLVGEFNGTTFIPVEGPYIMDQGPDFYAAQSFSRTSSPDLPEDKIIQIAWLDNWYGGTATTVWEREATFPVEIDLVTYRDEMRIKRTPIPAISTIYESTQNFGPQTITAGTNLLSGISSKKMDIITEFDLTGATADEIQFKIANKTIKYNIGNETLTTIPAHPDTKSTLLNPLSNNYLKIRILADWGQLEIFGNDGVFSYSEQFAFSPCDSALALTTVGGHVQLVSMEFHEICRTWEGRPLPGNMYDVNINTIGNGSVITDARWIVSQNSNKPITASFRKNIFPSNSKIMPLGASRVEGGRPDYESFRYELWKNLAENGWSFNFIGTMTDPASYANYSGQVFDKHHEGHGGYTSGQILSGIDGWIRSAGTPDIVLFSSPGGNDALEGLAVEDAISNINGIIDAIQTANPDVTIFIEQPAPGHSAIMTAELTAYIEQLQSEVLTIATQQTTTTSNVIAIDMFTGWSDAYLADDVHYNTTGAKVVADRYDAAMEAFYPVKSARGNHDIVYVDAKSASRQDGKSWETAYTELQDAIDKAKKGDQIWVAAGTYKPADTIDGTTDRHKSFSLKEGVALYGGFAGGEISTEERDWENRHTILSGDLNSNDQGFEGNEENSYHVIVGHMLSPETILDGFIVTGGNANAEVWPNDGGGGMRNYNGSPTIRNCVFTFNSAFADGGGIRNWEKSNTTFINIRFINNRSEQEGGGLMNGGNEQGSSPLIVNCRFKNNQSGEDGGALYNNWYSNPTVVNCLFIDNKSGLTGGAIYNVNHSESRIINCSISRNQSSKGGAISNWDSDPEILNCIIWGNQAEEWPGIYNERSKPVVAFSNVQDGYKGESIFSEDPEFAHDGLHLKINSPCIDAGNNLAVPEGVDHDLDANPRIINETVDMGAYEFLKSDIDRE